MELVYFQTPGDNLNVIANVQENSEWIIPLYTSSFVREVSNHPNIEYGIQRRNAELPMGKVKLPMVDSSSKVLYLLQAIGGGRSQLKKELLLQPWLQSKGLNCPDPNAVMYPDFITGRPQVRSKLEFPRSNQVERRNQKTGQVSDWYAAPLSVYLAYLDSDMSSFHLGTFQIGAQQVNGDKDGFSLTRL